MTPTGDRRREAAARLRQLADAHDAAEASRAARALELEYKAYGTVAAFDSADIRNLADLIDPTCHVESVDPTGRLLAYRLSCGDTAYAAHPALRPSYCPICGARVASGGD